MAVDSKYVVDDPGPDKPVLVESETSSEEYENEVDEDDLKILWPPSGDET